MKIRIQEIELGVRDPAKSKDFYQSLSGHTPVIDQDQLKVFKSGIPGPDFNVSAYLPENTMVISFLTDDLQACMKKLKENGIAF